jgi:hypothetical protein
MREKLSQPDPGRERREHRSVDRRNRRGRDELGLDRARHWRIRAGVR